MLENPWLTLTENLSTVDEEISPAKAAYILSQLLKNTGYDEFTQNTVEEVSPSEREARRAESSVRQTSQEDAIKTLSEIISEVHSGKSYESAIITASEVKELVEEVEQTVVVSPRAEDRLIVATDVIESVLTLTEEKISVNHSQQNIEDIHRYVIPIVLARLSLEGSTVESEDGEGGRATLYQSEKFTATLKVSREGEQFLTLDRNALIENESARALEATRESSQLRFEIIINNFTQQELDTIKAIAQQETQKKVQKVMQKSQQEELG